MATLPPLPQLRMPQQQQAPDYLDQYGRLAQLANSLQTGQLQRQELQQQIQGGQIENQIRQQQLNDALTLRQLSPQFVTKDANGNVTGYDYDGFFTKAASSGVSPQTIATLQKGISDATLARANATKAQLDNQTTLNNQAFEHLEGLRGVTDPNQRQQLWNSALQFAQKNAGVLQIDPSKLPQQVPDDNTLSTIEAGLGMHAQQLKDAQTKAEIAKNTGQGNQAQANADSATLKQYATTLAGSANQADYTNKLNAFETLHPELAGRFPQQFDPKNPQPVLSAAMTAPELADYMQKDRLTKYEQAQANYRAQLGRQTTFQNSRMLFGLNQIDRYTADPQHGYGQFVSQANAVRSAIDSAKNGNELAASLQPMMLALGASSFAGVHRINDTEINQAGPAVGSLFRKVNNFVSTLGSGKPTDVQLNEARDLIDQLSQARYNTYAQGVSAVAANAGLDPSKVSVFDQNGNVTSLSSIQGVGAKGGQAGSGGRGYAQTATNPKTRQQLGSNDGGTTWYDVQTGKRVQ